MLVRLRLPTTERGTVPSSTSQQSQQSRREFTGGPPEIDLDRPNIARVYDFYLGGSTNYAIDREFGERVLSDFPVVRPIARANRLFLCRVVRHLSALGVSQFVDIGCGMPTTGNVHQVADEVNDASRVVYVDHDPIAVAHTQILLEQHGDSWRHAALQVDLREPDELWKRVADTGVVDLEKGRPVADRGVARAATRA
jgi:S-adenosyl methyltransferase